MTKKHSLENLRSLEIINFVSHSEIPIHIIGLGAVGSRIFEQLVCLGARNIQLHDNDVVEHHNLHNQLFAHEDIGSSKVEAARSWFGRKYGANPDHTAIVGNQHWVTADTELEGIVIMAVDTFDARRDIMAASVKSGKVPLVIEGRCAPKFSEVRCVNPFNDLEVEAFLGSLGSDEDADPYLSICGMPISFAPVMTNCGLMMVFQLVNFLNQGKIHESQQQLNSITAPIMVLGAQPLQS